MTKTTQTIVCVILCVPAACMLAYSQAAFTGTILGTVTDQSGAVLPGAGVTVINQATGERESFLTDESGNYVLSNLKPGGYQLQVELRGFKRYTRSGLVLNVDQKLRIDVSLNIGEVSEEIQVIEAAPLMQTESASLGQVIDNRNIVDLPLNGRNPYNQIG